MQKLKKILRSATGSLRYKRYSFSQEGEDLIVDRLLEGQRDGIYIDIGCHHPFRFSNTYFFYKRGWRGLCIDPMPGTKRSFSRWRPRDIVVEAGVSIHPSSLTYYMFNESALNTFDKSLAQERNGLRGYKIEQEILIGTDTLRAIIENSGFSEAKDTVLMSIDVEGLDLDVLKSNDWNYVKPRIIIAECLSTDLTTVLKDPLVEFLRQKNYTPYAKMGNSIVFSKDL